MESKRLESRKTLRSGADKLAGTMISNFKNTLEFTQVRFDNDRLRFASFQLFQFAPLSQFERILKVGNHRPSQFIRPGT